MEEFALQTGDILPQILIIRESKVMLDIQVASLYGVENEVLLQAVANNADRFPEDFMFRLTEVEYQKLTSQIALTSEQLVKRQPPYAFTEQGVAIVSAFLASDKAKSIHITLIRDFVKMRQILDTDGDLIMDLKEMEEKYDHQFKVVFEALQKLIKTKETARKPIGFQIKEDTP